MSSSMAPLPNSIPVTYAPPSPGASDRWSPFRAPSVRLLAVRLKTFRPLPSDSAARSGSIAFFCPEILAGAERATA